MSFAPVLKLVAGPGITLTPASGQGIVRIDVGPVGGGSFVANEITYGDPAGSGALAQSPYLTFAPTTSSILRVNGVTGVARLELNGALDVNNQRVRFQSAGATFMDLFGARNNGTTGTTCGIVLTGVGASDAFYFNYSGGIRPTLGITLNSATRDVVAGTDDPIVTGQAAGFVWLPSTGTGVAQVPAAPSLSASFAGSRQAVYIAPKERRLWWYDNQFSNAWHYAEFDDGASSSGITQLTGDVTAGPGPGSVAATIAAGAVTYSKIQNVTNNRVLGNVSGGAAPPSELTAANLSTLLGLAPIATSGSATDLTTGTLPAARLGAFTGDATSAGGTYALTIAGLALSKLQTISDQRILGNVSGGAAVPAQLTAAQVATMVYGTFTNKDVLYATGANSVGQNSNFQFDAATTTLSVPTITVSGAVQGGAGGVLALQNAASPATSIGLTSSNIDVTGDVVPHASGSYSLGSITKFWDRIHAGVLAGDASLPGVIVMDDGAAPTSSLQVTSLYSQITTPSFSLTDTHSHTLFLTNGNAIAWFTDNTGSCVGQQTVTGSRSSGAALASLLTALANYNLIIDATSP